VKLVLFSDLHLDTKFSWLAGRPALAAQRRQGLRDTLVRIADLAESERADALLCGGDLYEHERFSPDTVAFVRTLFARLDPMPVFIAPGNHDWLGPASLYQQAEWSPNVHVFQQDRLEPIAITEGLTLWGAAHRAPANTDGFLDRFLTDRGGVHLALFHGSEQGALAFQESGKAPHAPFLSHQVAASGLHHAFLGHFHRAREAETYTYPGNPDPLAFGEDVQRGAVIATVAPNGHVSREWRRVAATSVHSIDVDVTGCDSLQDVRNLLSARLQGLDGFVQARLTGDLDPAIDLHSGSLEAAGQGLTALIVHTDSVRSAYDFETIRTEATVRGQFVRDVLDSTDLTPDEQRRVLVTGMRALDGRADLDVA
jgi:DNA repair exonuclease SbcCD nuclease subunit